MSEPNVEPSLIQQRMALQRQRNFALYTIVLSAVMFAGWAVTIAIDSSAPYRWIGLAVFGAGVGLGVSQMRKGT